MSNDNFDDIIKRNADNHQAPVPADAWDNIAKKKERKPLTVFWLTLSSLAIAGVAGLYVYSNSIHNNSNSISIDQNKRSGKIINANDYNDRSVSSTIKLLPKNNVNQLNRSIDSQKNDLQTNDQNSNAISKIERKRIDINHLSSDNSQNNGVKINSHSDNNIFSAKKYSKKKSDQINNNIALNGKGESHINDYLKQTTFNTISDEKIKNQSVQPDIASAVNNKNTTAVGYTKRRKQVFNKKGKYTTRILKPVVVEDEEAVNDNNVDQVVKNDSLTESKPTIATSKKTSTDSLAKSTIKKIDTAKIITQNKAVVKTPEKNNDPLFIVDVSVAPFIPIQQYDHQSAYTRIISNNSDHSVYVTNSMSTSLQPSVALAISIKKNISKKLLIGIGLGYTQIKENIKMTGQEIDTDYVFVKRLDNNSTGPYLRDDTTVTTNKGNKTIDAVNSYRIFSIPVFVSYNIYAKKKFTVGLTGGVCFNIARYHNKINGQFQSGTNNQAVNSAAPMNETYTPENETNNVTMDILAGVHFAWNINKKYQFFAEPNFRYNLNEYELKNSFINKRISAVGLSIGISYKFK